MDDGFIFTFDELISVMNTFSKYCFVLLSFALIVFCSPASAQDTILTIHRKKIIVKVVEVNPRDVLFKKFSNLSGPVYKVDRRDLIKIVYANGTIDTFNFKLAKIPEPVQKINSPPKFDPRSKDYFTNFVYLNFTDLFMGLITVGYEHTFNSGKASVRIPFSVGMSTLNITNIEYYNQSALEPVIPSGAYYFANKIFSSGIELSSFPYGQGTIKYYWGPAIDIGSYHYYTYESDKELPGEFNIKESNSPMFTVMLKNGLLIQPSKKFNISGFLGIGTYNLMSEPFSYTASENYSNGIFRYINMEIGINVGYKF